jgi:hypothetical protein
MMQRICSERYSSRSMEYVWVICPGWEEPEVVRVDENGRYHRIADGGIVQKEVRVVRTMLWPEKAV